MPGFRLQLLEQVKIVATDVEDAIEGTCRREFLEGAQEELGAMACRHADGGPKAIGVAVDEVRIQQVAELRVPACPAPEQGLIDPAQEAFRGGVAVQAR
ncbi:hypothetical protein D3C87_1802690 [compost metagenome]